MLAYKFRSSSQIAWALDIVYEQRLHCSDWSILNDPMEGFFRYSPEGSRRLKALTNAKNKNKVGCLSQTYGSRLLWAHYASGFDGMAVKVELPLQDFERTYHSVIYEPALPNVDLQHDLSVDATARWILRHKHTDWAYEDEVRIIQHEEWYRLPKPVECIIVGHRFNKALLKALRLVCRQKSITLKCTRVENGGVVAIDCIDR
jgi:hypothetical protein